MKNMARVIKVFKLNWWKVIFYDLTRQNSCYHKVVYFITKTATTGGWLKNKQTCIWGLPYETGCYELEYFCVVKGGGGGLRCPWLSLLQAFLSEQDTTCGKNDMAIWWVQFNPGPAVENPGYAPDTSVWNNKVHYIPLYRPLLVNQHLQRDKRGSNIKTNKYLLAVSCPAKWRYLQWNKPLDTKLLLKVIEITHMSLIQL